jgi:hypothetical protein
MIVSGKRGLKPATKPSATEDTALRPEHARVLQGVWIWESPFRRLSRL